jgi:hypothetical protein
LPHTLIVPKRKDVEGWTVSDYAEWLGVAQQSASEKVRAAREAGTLRPVGTIRAQGPARTVETHLYRPEDLKGL